MGNQLRRRGAEAGPSAPLSPNDDKNNDDNAKRKKPRFKPSSALFLAFVIPVLVLCHFYTNFETTTMQKIATNKTTTSRLLSNKQISPQKEAPTVKPAPTTKTQNDKQQQLATATQELFLFIATPKSGPGNQVVSIKEGLLVAEVLGRTPIIGPIFSHYTSKESKSWDFHEIFQYSKPWVPASPQNVGKAKTRLLFNNCSDCRIDQPIETALQTTNIPQELMPTRQFRSTEQIKTALGDIQDPLLYTKLLFNSVRIQTSRLNGVFQDPYNPSFQESHQKICVALDFSNAIKARGDAILKESNLKDYTAVHLRYPDSVGGKTLDQYAGAGFTEEELAQALKAQFPTGTNFFIATNKPKLAKKSALSFATFIPESVFSDPLSTFIEQYICSRAKTFVMSTHNDFNVGSSGDTRSTWSSFVWEYRLFRGLAEHDSTVDLLVSAKSQKGR